MKKPSISKKSIPWKSREIFYFSPGGNIFWMFLQFVNNCTTWSHGHETFPIQEEQYQLSFMASSPAMGKNWRYKFPRWQQMIYCSYRTCVAYCTLALKIDFSVLIKTRNWIWGGPPVGHPRTLENGRNIYSLTGLKFSLWMTWSDVAVDSMSACQYLHGVCSR